MNTYRWEAALAIFFLLVVLLLTFCVRPVAATGCIYYEPNPPNEPSGVKGCELYGEGTASTWDGPGVARNDCLYPWTTCAPIRITSLEPDSYGNWIEVRPTMYCDCYMKPGPNGEQPRMVDLGADIVKALDLPGPGLWNVRIDPLVFPIDGGVVLPNTAMQP